MKKEYQVINVNSEQFMQLSYNNNPVLNIKLSHTVGCDLAPVGKYGFAKIVNSNSKFFKNNTIVKLKKWEK